MPALWDLLPPSPLLRRMEGPSPVYLAGVSCLCGGQPGAMVGEHLPDPATERICAPRCLHGGGSLAAAHLVHPDLGLRVGDSAAFEFARHRRRGRLPAGIPPE